jgi:hypothetical protein
MTLACRNAPDSGASAGPEPPASDEVLRARAASSTDGGGVQVAQHRPPPRRSQGVLPITPEYPPPLSGPGEFQFWVRTPYVNKGSRFEVGRLDGVAQASCFVSDRGRIITAHGSEPDKTGRTIDGHRFVLVPDAPLSPDQWYALLLTGDDFLRVSDEFAAPVAGSAGAVARFPFFNGSAPRIVAVRRAVDADFPPRLEVVFSEPLRITDSLCRSLVGARRAHDDRDCESKRGQLAGRVQLELTRGSTAASGLLELRLPVDARGQQRAAAETAKVLHRSPPEALVLRLSPRDFSSCGAEQCWREPAPAELARVARNCEP